MGWLMCPVSCWFLWTLLLAAPLPGASWYKHSASPRYHTVGRASGLLIGVRRSPYLWRRDAKEDTWPVIEQVAEENAGLLQAPWTGEEAGLQLSLDPGEKRFIKNLIQESKLRSFEERNLNEVQEGENLEQGAWLYNDLGEDSLEDQSQVTKFPEKEERRSLEENMVATMEPEEEKRSLEETWVTKEPTEVVRRLESGKRKVRNQDRRVRSSSESGLQRRPSKEDILSRFLHLQEENRSHPQPWRTPTAKDKQPSYSKTSQWISCEDFRLSSYKFMCRARLQFLSNSQPQPGRSPYETEEDPTTDL